MDYQIRSSAQAVGWYFAMAQTRSCVPNVTSENRMPKT